MRADTGEDQALRLVSEISWKTVGFLARRLTPCRQLIRRTA
jgi:hypothetical protein